MKVLGNVKHIKISKSSTVWCVQNMTQVILKRKDQFIKFPNCEASIQLMKKDFMEYTGLPSIIGNYYAIFWLINACIKLKYQTYSDK